MRLTNCAILALTLTLFPAIGQAQEPAPTSAVIHHDRSDQPRWVAATPDQATNGTIMGRPDVTFEGCGLTVVDEHLSGRRATRLMQANTDCLAVTGGTSVQLARALPDVIDANTRRDATTLSILTGRPLYVHDDEMAVGAVVAQVAARTDGRGGYGYGAADFSAFRQDLYGASTPTGSLPPPELPDEQPVNINQDQLEQLAVENVDLNQQVEDLQAETARMQLALQTQRAVIGGLHSAPKP